MRTGGNGASGASGCQPRAGERCRPGPTGRGAVPYPAMADETEPPYSLMCSACYTPCTGADAHVVPRWNPDRQMVITAYRCGGCRPAAPEERHAVLLAIVDAVDAGRLVLNP